MPTDTSDESLERPHVPRVIMLGVFDGLHTGHRALLREVFAIAHQTDLKPAVATFWPHPAAVVAPGRLPRILQPLEARLKAFEQAGMAREHIFKISFTPELSALTPEAFARSVLVEGMGAQHVVVGNNFFFGHRRSGNIQTLRDLGGRLGFGVTCVDAVVHPVLGTVSSTAIRTLMATGRLTDAASLWGQTPRLYPLLSKAFGPEKKGRIICPRDPQYVWVPDGIYETSVGPQTCWLEVDNAGAALSGVSKEVAAQFLRIPHDVGLPLKKQG